MPVTLTFELLDQILSLGYMCSKLVTPFQCFSTYHVERCNRHCCMFSVMAIYSLCLQARVIKPQHQLLNITRHDKPPVNKRYSAQCCACSYQVSQVVEAVRIATPVTQCSLVALFRINILLSSSLNNGKVHPCCCKVWSKSTTKYEPRQLWQQQQLQQPFV